MQASSTGSIAFKVVIALMFHEMMITVFFVASNSHYDSVTQLIFIAWDRRKIDCF
jgi:hypothetical protein